MLIDRAVYQPYLSWQGAEQDTLFQTAGADLVNRIREYAKSIGADNPYLYLDYADVTQNPLASYGPENVEKMKREATEERETDLEALQKKLEECEIERCVKE